MASRKIKVTNKDRRFLTSYVLDYKKSKAAKDAGISYARANAILASTWGKKKLAELQAEVTTDYGVTREAILTQLGYALNRDIADLIGDDGFIESDVRKIPEAMRACINSIKQRVIYDRDGQVEEVVNEIRLVPKEKAIELAMKHKGMLEAAQSDKEGVATIDWDSMLTQGKEADLLEQRLGIPLQETMQREEQEATLES